VAAAESPRRIVSLVPSMTESVCRLGAADRLVGVTRYCVEPADELRAVARVGGTKNPKLEAIAALEPDLVLVNTEENRSEDVAWLRARMPVLEHCPRTVVEAAAALRFWAAWQSAASRIWASALLSQWTAPRAARARSSWRRAG
jgi:hypothetical protein